MIITLECTDGSISFWRRVSSETGFDVLRFSIDNKPVAQWSGELPWEEVSFPVKAGQRTFMWEYVKDDSGASGQDTAWIDNIRFPQR